MLTSTIIKNFIKNNIVPGTIISVSDIHTIIKQYFSLTDDDWAPHTTTRPTHYPRWKHRVQAVLSSMKKNGVIIHYPATNEYEF